MRTFLSMLALFGAALIAVKIGAPELIRDQFGAFAPLVTVPLHVATVAATPGADEAFGLTNGILYGIPLGFALSWFGWFAGSVVQFWVPGAGGHLASIIPGAAGVPLRRFLWCTAIATSIVAMGWTYAGVRLAQLPG